MIGFCLVGGGFIGPLHAANIAAHPGAHLAWVADLDLPVATRLASKRSSAVGWWLREISIPLEPKASIRWS